jgi:GT2 family glycosyltransferase
MDNREQRIAAVVVSYNVRGLLLACVASLVDALQAGEVSEIIVVDNASRDGSADAIRVAFPTVHVIEAENNGYGAGANVGIAASASQYVLVLNPDTVVPPGTMGALADYLDCHPDVAIVGPRLRYPTGEIQATRRRFPQRLTPLFESTILQEWWPSNPWVRAYTMADLPGDIPQTVDWVVGAAMLVRRAAIDAVGGFDTQFRLYSEEVEWSWRMHRHGWRTAYLPTVEVLHHEGASALQDLSARQQDFDRSRVRLMRRMYGRRWAGVVRLALLVNYGVLLLREAVKWVVGHRRTLRQARMALYWRALRSGLRIEGEDDT